jgi:hypothetical protein
MKGPTQVQSLRHLVASQGVSFGDALPSRGRVAKKTIGNQSLNN